MYNTCHHSISISQCRRKDSCPSMPRKLTPSEVRAKVVEEILNTERDYVKHLDDIIEVRVNYATVYQGRVKHTLSWERIL